MCQTSHFVWWEIFWIIQFENIMYIIFFSGPYCTDSFCGPRHAETSINKCACFSKAPKKKPWKFLSLIRTPSYLQFTTTGKTTPSIQDSHWCQSLQVEGSTGSNQLSTQPQKHKEDGRCLVSMSIDRLSRDCAVQLDEAHERRRENHVLDLCSIQY